jgi:hypothetical protein
MCVGCSASYFTLRSKETSRLGALGFLFMWSTNLGHLTPGFLLTRSRKLNAWSLRVLFFIKRGWHIQLCLLLQEMKKAQSSKPWGFCFNFIVGVRGLGLTFCLKK